MQVRKNPLFLMEQAEKLDRALERKADTIVSAARSNASWSSTIPQGLVRSAAKDGVVQIGRTKAGFKLDFYERGTSKVAARPVLKPAVEQERSKPLELN
jgi:hypothetical protein